MQPLQPGKHMLWLCCCWVQACQTRQGEGEEGGGWPLQCLWLSVAWLDWLGWYLYFTGRLRARWSRLASSATPGSRPTWPRSPEPMKLSLRAEGPAGSSRLPLRLFTRGTDTAATPLRGPLQTSPVELWFSLADLYWYVDDWIRGPSFTAKWRGVKIRICTMQVNGLFGFFFKGSVYPNHK